MKTYKVGDQLYGPEDVAALREKLIVIRDEALTIGNFGDTVALTHTIALLASVAEDLASGD